MHTSPPRATRKTPGALPTIGLRGRFVPKEGSLGLYDWVAYSELVRQVNAQLEKNGGSPIRDTDDLLARFKLLRMEEYHEESLVAWSYEGEQTVRLYAGEKPDENSVLDIFVLAAWARTVREMVNLGIEEVRIDEETHKVVGRQGKSLVHIIPVPHHGFTVSPFVKSSR